MAIRVKHGSGLESLSSAFMSGQGQKRERTIERRTRDRLRRLAMALQDRQFRDSLNYRKENAAASRQHDLTRMDKKADIYSNRQAGRHADRKELAEMRSDEQAERDQRRYEFEQQESAQRQQGRLDELDKRSELERDNIRWQYTESQKREVEKINQGLSWINQQVSDGKWTPDQGQAAKQQLMGKLNGIEKLPVLDTSPDPSEILEDLTVYDKNGRMLFQDPKSGKYYIPDDPDAKRAADIKMAKAKFVQDLLKEKIDTVGKDGKSMTSKPMYTVEEAKQKADEVFGDTEKPAKNDTTPRREDLIGGDYEQSLLKPEPPAETQEQQEEPPTPEELRAQNTREAYEIGKQLGYW